MKPSIIFILNQVSETNEIIAQVLDQIEDSEMTNFRFSPNDV